MGVGLSLDILVIKKRYAYLVVYERRKFRNRCKG